MATASRGRLTAEEYLQIERAADTKSEFFDGEMFAMAGATREHNLIVTNLARELSARLRDCDVYPSDMRVALPSGLYTYPDVSVVCGRPTLQGKDTLLDPLLVVEVLSPSTEAYDRGRKFEHYRSLPSLREYLLVSTSAVLVERFRLTGEGWLLDDAAGRDAVLRLSSVDAQLPLAEVYARVEMPDQPPLRPPVS